MIILITYNLLLIDKLRATLKTYPSTGRYFGLSKGYTLHCSEYFKTC